MVVGAFGLNRVNVSLVKNVYIGGRFFMKKFEWQGCWKLPDKERTLVGTLKYTPIKGAYLELMGEFLDELKGEIDIILGRTSDGKEITLVRSFQINKTFYSNGFPTIKIFSQYVFEGVHFNSKNDIKFKKLSCRYSNLDEWAWFNNIEIEYSNKELHIKYKLPTVISANINDDYKIQVHPITERPALCVVQKEVALKERIYITIINNSLKSFEEHLEILFHIQKLITLGVGENVITIDLIGNTKVGKKVKIYFFNKKSQENYRSIFPLNMFFCLRHIKDKFEKYIKNWFDRKEIILPVFNLYFGTLYNKEMYEEQRFLSLIQALEVFHRRTRSGKEMDRVSHKKRIKDIIEAVDEKYKKWLNVTSKIILCKTSFFAI